MSARPFEAKYPGRCDANGCAFDEGARIGYAEGYDKPLCESCWLVERDDYTPDAQACPRCWLIHAGECA